MQEIHQLQRVWKKDKNEGIVNKVLWVIIILLIIVIFLELLFQFIIIPQLKIRNIIVESDLLLSEDEVLHIAKVKKNLYYFSLHTEEIKENLENYPAVRSARVEKQFPDILKLEVRKRIPVAVTFIQDQGKSLPGLIDREGVIFRIGRLDDNEYNLPIISGFDFKRYNEGMKMPDLLLSFFDQLYLLKKNARTLYDFISEIKILPVGKNEFELLYYMIPYTTKIRCGNSVNEQVLTYGIMVLDILNKQGMTSTVKEIDFRSKEIVYKHQQGGDV